MTMRSTLILAALAALSGGCSSPPATTTSDSSKVGTAVTTPLSDLNIVSAAIPELLQAAQRQPYAAPADSSCAALQAQVRALDEVLGPDLDAPASETNPGLLERGSNAAGDAAVGALQRTAEGLVPFRGWVRKLSGAEKYSKQVAASIAAGSVRRGFLKGIAASRGCAASA